MKKPKITLAQSPTVPRNVDVIYQGDCLDVMRDKLADRSINLIVTSPPYADQRKKTYGGVRPDEYVEWFLPIAAELKRVLAADGSFVLNIKERVVEGERSTYVIDLIKALRDDGWVWTEEYIWHKRNSHPGKWPNRFRDSWERCLHFTLQRDFKMYQEAVMVPMGDWRHSRLKNLSETDKRRDNSKVNSGFGKKIQNWVGREMAFPSNVLHLATECGNRNHSATFPEELPAWFIKLFTVPGDVVLDPFSGSGTSAVAAAKLERRYVGIELDREFVEIAKQRLDLEQKPAQIKPATLRTSSSSEQVGKSGSHKYLTRSGQVGKGASGSTTTSPKRTRARPR